MQRRLESIDNGCRTNAAAEASYDRAWCSLATLRDGSYSCRHEPLTIDGNWLWNHALNLSSGNTVQYDAGRVLMWLVAVVYVVSANFLAMGAVGILSAIAWLIDCFICAVQRRLPFSRIHEAPQSLYSGDQACFMPGQRITVQIFKIDQSEHLQLLNRNLYASVCYSHFALFVHFTIRDSSPGPFFSIWGFEIDECVIPGSSGIMDWHVFVIVNVRYTWKNCRFSLHSHHVGEW